MYDEEDCPEHVDNPLLMTGMEFKMWLSGRGVDSVGIPPGCPIQRADLLLEVSSTGKVSLSEIGSYLSEIGLMMPISET
ncbi:MAG: hypothetical protein KKA10_17365 [Euryarchaeota archaeon]|nr:hypothetical protein [Euryarchaeota archaeon]MCG2738150.1 hypothetical protein [Candidatus Methanoperedenaceae archaeon]